MPTAGLKNKKVTVIGLGLHGGGVASVKWLVKHNAKVTVTDLRTKKELQQSLNKLKGLKVKYILGKHNVADFKAAEVIVQNPGVPRQSKYLAAARKAGVPIENDASLFFKNCKAEIIGVSGTRGKSTTSTLIYELLKKGRKKVYLAGLPQKPILEILDKVSQDDIVVLELSSWQLEILGNYKLSPHISIVTNIYPDHLNRYSGMNSYIKAKKNIISWQTRDDIAILNLDNIETKRIGQQVIAKRFWFSKSVFKDQNGCFVKNQSMLFRLNGKENKLAEIKDIRLFGWHNLENVLASLAATATYNISAKDIKSVLKSFKGLSGRLELVKEKSGIKYINDTTATTPDAAMAALKLAKKKNVVLIAGGDSKNIPDYKFKEFSKVIKNSCKAIVLFSGNGSEQIKKEIKTIKFKKYVFEVSNMTEAISIAKSFAVSGDTILLSPACASFGLFINEFDRGDQFKKVVSKI